MKIHRSTSAAFDREFNNWPVWVTRALIVAAACAAGVMVADFTWLGGQTLARAIATVVGLALYSVLAERQLANASAAMA